MPTTKSFLPGLAFVALLGSCAVASAAQPYEPFALTASIVHEYDTNFFRLTDGERPIVDGQSRNRDESLNTASAGAVFDKTWSRQRFRGSGDFHAVRFGRYDYLDYDAIDYRIEWDWQIGRRWSGALGHQRTEQGRSFADFVLTTQSINTYQNAYASIDLTLPSRWKVGVGAASVSSRFSDELSAAEEYDEDSADLHVTLRSSSANTLTFAIRRADASYVNRQLSVKSDSAYRQTDARVIGELRFSPKSELGGYIGIARRNFPVLTSRNYSGPIGRIKYSWMPTPKLRLSSVLRRELGASEDLTDTFVVTSAADIKLEWQLRLKLRAIFEVSAESKDYGGDPGLGLTNPTGATDRQWSQGLALSYEPHRYVDVFLGVRHEARTSGVAARHFEDYRYQGGIRLHL